VEKSRELIKGKISFVSISLVVNAVIMARTMFFMRFLDSYDLGVLIIIQSLIAFLPLTQLGLINGGLRILSIDSYADTHRKANNTIFTYILLIYILLLLASGILSKVVMSPMHIVSIAVTAGALSLLKNWQRNILVARRRLRILNVVEIISTTVSAVIGIFVIRYGVRAAIASIFAQYGVSVFIFYIFVPSFRISQLTIHKKVFMEALSFGFIPYLTGLSMLLYQQVDKFLIARYLSVETLGSLYLAYAFIRLFEMLPTSISPLFESSAFNQYFSGDVKGSIKQISRYTVILGLYCLMVIFALLFIGEAVVRMIVPDKIDQLRYVFLLLPGVVASTMSKGFTFALNVAYNLRVILYVQVFSVCAYLAFILVMIHSESLSLIVVSVGKAAEGLLVYFLFLVAVVLNVSRIKNRYYLKKAGKI